MEKARKNASGLPRSSHSLAPDSEEFHDYSDDEDNGEEDVTRAQVQGSVKAHLLAQQEDRAELNSVTYPPYKQGYITVVDSLDQFMYTFVKQFAEPLPDQLNVFKAFKLSEEIPALEAFTEIDEAFVASEDGTVSRREIKRFLRKQVRKIERRENFLEFAFLMFEATGNPYAEQFRAQQALFTAQVDSYYTNQMKQFRRYHDIWNKVPVNDATAFQLFDTILQNYQDSKELLAQMRDLGITLDDELIDELISQDALYDDSLTPRNRIMGPQRKIISKIVRKVTRQADRKGLRGTPEFDALYDEFFSKMADASNPDSAFSLINFSLKKKRAIVPSIWYSKYLSQSQEQGWLNVVPETDLFDEKRKALLEGFDVPVYEILEPQRARIHEYLAAAKDATRAFGVRNNDQLQAGETASQLAFQFFRHYILRMNRWQYQVKDVSL